MIPGISRPEGCLPVLRAHLLFQFEFLAVVVREGACEIRARQQRRSRNVVRLAWGTVRAASRPSHPNARPRVPSRNTDGCGSAERASTSTCAASSRAARDRLSSRSA